MMLDYLEISQKDNIKENLSHYKHLAKIFTMDEIYNSSKANLNQRISKKRFLTNFDGSDYNLCCTLTENYQIVKHSKFIDHLDCFVGKIIKQFKIPRQNDSRK